MASGVFVVRYVDCDTEFADSAGDKYMIRQGDRIAIYPPALHKDGDVFEDPLVSLHTNIMTIAYIHVYMMYI